MKIIILTLALIGVASAKKYTTFEVVPRSAKPLFFTPKSEEFEVSYPVGYVPNRAGQEYVAPPDVGGNYGDNFWNGINVSYEDLVIREIQINKINREEDQIINWKVEIPDPDYRPRQIICIRIINIGRQRAYVQSITASRHGAQNASAVILVPKNQQARLLIEVYAY